MVGEGERRSNGPSRGTQHNRERQLNYDAWKTTPPDDGVEVDGREVSLTIERDGIEVEVLATVGDAEAVVATAAEGYAVGDAVALTLAEQAEAEEYAVEDAVEREADARERAAEERYEQRREAADDDR